MASGQPLFTPSVLGTTLFRLAVQADTVHPVSVSLLVVALFTVLHFAVFAGIGIVSVILLELLDQHPGVVFGLLLVLVLGGGFNLGAMLFAEPILKTLWWPSVVVANLLAAIAMGGYLWLRRRRRLRATGDTGQLGRLG